MKPRHWIALGALVTGLAVAMGAFGAHSLEERLAEAGQLANWETAVRYQAWHGLALVLFGVARRGGAAIGWCFLLGSVCFSGSLYALALGAPASVIWPVTPLGGLLFLVGWGLLAAAALRAPDDS